ncbi:unnamed protein product [Durusdinium trenchii]|uniref:Uncharacterized protein n=1 Tax=Durusdinium trenchii TaxID=1381693 RepID=A0ABP0IK44_9DINO
MCYISSLHQDKTDHFAFTLPDARLGWSRQETDCWHAHEACVNLLLSGFQRSTLPTLVLFSDCAAQRASGKVVKNGARFRDSSEKCVPAEIRPTCGVRLWTVFTMLHLKAS